MKVFLLAGGFGTRLAEYSNVIPKPMVPIGDKPILWRIMKTFANYGHNEFFVGLGYKSEVIKDYFLNYYTVNSDFTVDLNDPSFSLSLQNSKTIAKFVGFDIEAKIHFKYLKPFFGKPKSYQLSVIS